MAERIQEKLDVLDLVINVLLEHEKKLDQLTERLENLAEILDKIIEREAGEK